MNDVINVRNPYLEDENGNSTNEENVYYEENLDEIDYSSLVGYDSAVDIVLDGFFRNIENYAEIFGELFKVENVDADAVLDDSIDFDTTKKEYSDETKMMSAMRNSLIHYFEVSRNQIVIALLENKKYKMQGQEEEESQDEIDL